MEDKRLQQVNNAALGANEGTGADGGFLIQTDFAGQILESAVQQSPLLNRLDRQTCSSAANAMRWLSVDETDVSKSVFGGVQMYWASEAGTVAASRPQFREMKMDLEKMMGFAYATDEMLTDAAFMTGFFGSAFTLAADRLLTESVISGDGAGKPLGLLHSKALLAVDKESSQAAGTFTGANAIKMQALGHAPAPGPTGVADAPRRGGAAALIWPSRAARRRPSSCGTPREAWATSIPSGCSTSRCCLRTAAPPWAARATSCWWTPRCTSC